MPSKKVASSSGLQVAWALSSSAAVKARCTFPVPRRTSQPTSLPSLLTRESSIASPKAASNAWAASSVTSRGSHTSPAVATRATAAGAMLLAAMGPRRLASGSWYSGPSRGAWLKTAAFFSSSEPAWLWSLRVLLPPRASMAWVWLRRMGLACAACSLTMARTRAGDATAMGVLAPAIRPSMSWLACAEWCGSVLLMLLSPLAPSSFPGSDEVEEEDEEVHKDMGPRRFREGEGMKELRSRPGRLRSATGPPSLMSWVVWFLGGGGREEGEMGLNETGGEGPTPRAGGGTAGEGWSGQAWV